MKISATNLIEFTETKFPNHFAHMVGQKQNPAHHHNDVWGHTVDVINVVQDMIDCEDLGSAKVDPKVVLFAALLHDIGKGKPECTGEKDGQPTFYGHAKEGVKYAKQFLAEYAEFTPEEEKLILWLVEEHMNIHQLSGEKSYRKWLVKQAKSGLFEEELELTRALKYLVILGAADAASKYTIDSPNYKVHKYEVIGEYHQKYIDMYRMHIPICIEDLHYIYTDRDVEFEDKINNFIINLCHEGQIKNRVEEIKEAVEKRLARLAS